MSAQIAPLTWDTGEVPTLLYHDGAFKITLPSSPFRGMEHHTTELRTEHLDGTRTVAETQAGDGRWHAVHRT